MMPRNLLARGLLRAHPVINLVDLDSDSDSDDFEGPSPEVIEIVQLDQDEEEVIVIDDDVMEGGGAADNVNGIGGAVGGQEVEMADAGEAGANNNFEDPFILPEVLENILRFIALKEINPLRSVCKLWKSETDRNIKTRGRVRLLQIDRLIAYITNHRRKAETQNRCPHDAFRICYPSPYGEGREIMERELARAMMEEDMELMAPPPPPPQPPAAGAAVNPQNPPNPPQHPPHPALIRLENREHRAEQQSQLYKTKLIEFWRIFGAFVKDLYLDCNQIQEGELRNILDTCVPNLETLILSTPPTDRVYMEEEVRYRFLQREYRRRRILPAGGAAGGGGGQGAAGVAVPMGLRRGRGPPEPGPAPPGGPLEPLSLPNLKVLIIKYYRGKYQAANLKRFLKFIFSSAPNLQKVRIEHLKIAEITEEERRAPLEALLESNPETELRHLVEMDFSSMITLTEADVNALRSKMPPRLQSIKLSFARLVRSSSISSLVLSLSPELKNLEIKFLESMPRPELVFPEQFTRLILAKLRSLKLVGFKGPLSFLSALANIERIELNGISEDFRENLFVDGRGGGGGGRRMDSLNSFSSDTQISNRNFESLACLATNIRKLELTFVNDDGLRSIFMNLPLCTTLKLTKGLFTDCGITGVKEELCKELVSTETHVAECPENFRSGLFIGSLPHLANLTLESDEISDLAITFGLTSCFKLRKLTLASPKITVVGVSLLERVIGKSALEWVDLRQCPNAVYADIEFLRKRNSGVEIMDPMKAGDPLAPPPLQLAPVAPIPILFGEINEPGPPDDHHFDQMAFQAHFEEMQDLAQMHMEHMEHLELMQHMAHDHEGEEEGEGGDDEGEQEDAIPIHEIGLHGMGLQFNFHGGPGVVDLPIPQLPPPLPPQLPPNNNNENDDGPPPFFLPHMMDDFLNDLM